VVASTVTGVVGETIRNWEQSPPPRSATVTITFVPPVALSVALAVVDCNTTTLPNGSGSGATLRAARAIPPPLDHTSHSNNPSQRFDIEHPQNATNAFYSNVLQRILQWA
jgi:hypothetical protein